MKALPNLYPVRFILASLVILYHIPAISKGFGVPTFDDYPIFHKGTMAVLYFFSLSGFLIIRLIYLEMRDKKSFNFKNFYLRRVQRLYPVYYLVFLIGLLLYHVFLPMLNIGFEVNYEVWELVLSYVFLVPNIFKFYYPDVGSVLLILWSIGVEEQFYLFIPVLLYLGRKKLLTTLCVIFVIMIVVLFSYPEAYKFANYYFFFIFGGLCSVLCESRRYPFLNSKLVSISIVILVLITFFTDYLREDKGPWVLLVHCIISGLFFTVIAYYPKFEIKSKLLDRLGKISYGIYMYHMIIITGLLFAFNTLKLEDVFSEVAYILIFNILTFVLTIIISSLSYDYFEKLFYSPRKFKSD